MSDNIYNKKAWLDRFIHEESPDIFDRERLSRIKAAIPQGVRTVLDIGIGGGYIFRELKYVKGLDCFGIDISLELVKRLGDGNVLVGDAGDIPFSDGEFDLVLAGDLIEHLKEDFFEKSISEIVRVAKKYVLINSPYKDAVNWPVSLCGSCKREFNIYGHMRKIDMPLVRNIFPSSRFNLVKIETLGRRRDPRPDLLVNIARRWGKVYSKEGAVCPYCYRSAACEPSRNLFEKITGRTVAGMFFLMDNLIPPVFKSKSEILLLIEKH